MTSNSARILLSSSSAISLKHANCFRRKGDHGRSLSLGCELLQRHDGRLVRWSRRESRRLRSQSEATSRRRFKERPLPLPVSRQTRVSSLSGGFAYVYAVQDVSTGHEYALKVNRDRTRAAIRRIDAFFPPQRIIADRENAPDAKREISLLVRSRAIE